MLGMGLLKDDESIVHHQVGVDGLTVRFLTFIILHSDNSDKSNQIVTHYVPN